MNPHRVLIGRIPHGGRPLTRAEWLALKRLGITVLVRAWVMPWFGTNYTGGLYRQQPNGCWGLDIPVRVREP